MRRYFPVVLAFLIAGAFQVQGAGKKNSVLKTPEDKKSYAIGFSVGTNLKRQGAEVEFDLFLRGVRDGIAGKKPLLSPVEYRKTMKNLTANLRQKQQKKKAAAAGKNVREGRAFLAANKNKTGVVTLPSGLQYKVLKAGTGKKPKAADTVVTHYRGTLINGVEFDSSYARKSPATFPVKGVISGWTEALQLMKVGAKWKLFIPSNLAYGKRGSGPKIGPNATLLFEIELLEIK